MKQTHAHLNKRFVVWVSVFPHKKSTWYWFGFKWTAFSCAYRKTERKVARDYVVCKHQSLVHQLLNREEKDTLDASLRTFCVYTVIQRKHQANFSCSLALPLSLSVLLKKRTRIWRNASMCAWLFFVTLVWFQLRLPQDQKNKAHAIMFICLLDVHHHVTQTHRQKEMLFDFRLSEWQRTLRSDTFSYSFEYFICLSLCKFKSTNFLSSVYKYTMICEINNELREFMKLLNSLSYDIKSVKVLWSIPICNSRWIKPHTHTHTHAHNYNCGLLWKAVKKTITTRNIYLWCDWSDWIEFDWIKSDA